MSRTPQPSDAIYTTLDKDFQLATQQALEGFRGAIVVLEKDTGRVLAMASSPEFDPNAFEPLNYNYYTLLNELFANPDNPQLNRATQGQYPLGSVFKIITMSAALESERFTPESTLQCGYFFEELDGVRLNDWTYDHFQNDGKTQPSGLLTLPEGLDPLLQLMVLAYWPGFVQPGSHQSDRRYGARVWTGQQDGHRREWTSKPAISPSQRARSMRPTWRSGRDRRK